MTVSVRRYLRKQVKWSSGTRGRVAAKQGKVIFAHPDGFPDGWVPPLELNLRGTPKYWSSLAEYHEYAAASRNSRRFECFSRKYVIVKVARVQESTGRVLIPHYYAPNVGALGIVRNLPKYIRDYYEMSGSTG